ncbi:Gas vesicle synthesis protein GvpL/GvpF [Halobacillus alkaliphilus]|uniref:Gas vesicle synthesis protein GvpL/GvpF n=1 Tax=Halobacillus alkaliphilus TaxID=396056 RepID=A0A1I2KJA7_9BACI|nr:GvpL/GvpF family gas vesicle protein [Halobacillus alkaliphilus]SFF67065.1 Gas vesicle synthesis protein GvpL/GvpF [Halobacillus alkaliphilus]
MAEELGIYVFCCIQTNEEKNFGTIEFEGEERSIFTIHYKDAAMVATEAPVKIYTPKKDHLMTHQNVISRVMESEPSVVPISFGNVFQTREDTEVLLENLYPQLARLFPEVENKIEIGLKVVGKKEWLENEVNKNNKVMKQKETVSRKSEDAGYFDRIKLGEMAQDFFNNLKAEIEKDIHTPLVRLSESSKSNDTVGEKMLLNGAYLIDRDNEQAFDEKVNELHERWKDRVEFKYTGPWPAYNFINIKLKVEETT